MLLRTSLDRPGGAQTSSKDTSEDSSVGDALEKKIVCKDNAMPPILLPLGHNAKCSSYNNLFKVLFTNHHHR